MRKKEQKSGDKPEPEYRLEDLVALITPENAHGEVDLGRPVGREVWE